MRREAPSLETLPFELTLAAERLALEGGVAEPAPDGDAPRSPVLPPDMAAINGAVTFGTLSLEAGLQPDPDGVVAGGAPPEGPARVAYLTLAADTLESRVLLADADDAVTSSSASAGTEAALNLDVFALPAPEGAEGPLDFRVEGLLASGAGQSFSRQTGEGSSVETRSSSASSRATLTATPERIEGDLRLRDVAASIAGDRIPLPQVAFSAEAMGFGVSLPVAVPEAPAEGGVAPPQTARLTAEIADLALDEALWAALDPEGALPRTPGQLSLDAEADIAALDPAAQALAPEGLPGRMPTALRLNTLALAFGGATAQASGAVALGAGGPFGMPDMNAAEGSLDIDATGVTQLIDAIVAAGLVSPEQAMGARMMLGMFATMAPDGSLRSRIVAGPEGSLSINGMRLR